MLFQLREDNRFFEHGAVDFRRLVGAVVSNLTSGFGSQGWINYFFKQLIKKNIFQMIIRVLNVKFKKRILAINLNKIMIKNRYLQCM